MARRRIPPGAHGDIAVRRVGKSWEASCRCCTRWGQVVRVKRTGRTKDDAKANLKEATAALLAETRRRRISGETRFKVIVDKWFTAMEMERDLGTRSPNTVRSDRTGKNHITGRLGELPMNELDTSVCDDFLQALRKSGMRHDALLSVRRTLSNICGYAVRHGALPFNPVRDVTRLVRGEADSKEPRALTASERDDLFAKLDSDLEAVRQDLPGLLRGMLATGVRISELLGCVGDDVVRDPGTGRMRLTVDYRIVRIPGEGLTRRRRSASSTKGGGQLLWLPSWVESLFAARKLASGGVGPLFPNPHNPGGWRNPSGHTSDVLRAALDRAGYPWMRSHVMRATVSTEGDRAGVDVKEIGAQVGHRNERTTKTHYIERRAGNDAMLPVLDSMGPQSGTNAAR